MDAVLIKPRAAAEAQKPRPTLRSLHNALIAKLAALPVGPEPSVYDNWELQAECLEDRAAYLRAIKEALRPVLERIEDDAFGCAGAKPESFDLVADAFNDFLAPLEIAADDLRIGR